MQELAPTFVVVEFLLDKTMMTSLMLWAAFIDDLHTRMDRFSFHPFEITIVASKRISSFFGLRRRGRKGLIVLLLEFRQKAPDFTPFAK